MQGKSFRLLGRSLMAMAIAPEPPFQNWFRELDTLLAGSPGFFAGRPIILDASAMNAGRVELAEFVEQLRERGIRVMAIEGAGEGSLSPELPPVITGARQWNAAERAVPATSADEPKANPEMLLIDRPVRSGQTIYFKNDVTIIGSVSSGAEIVAGGSIHIYGALRGRAIAGTVGNGASRIFCRRLEAELIAIGGVYQTADNMPPELHGEAAQARLDGDALSIVGLN